MTHQRRGQHLIESGRDCGSNSNRIVPRLPQVYSCTFVPMTVKTRLGDQPFRHSMLTGDRQNAWPQTIGQALYK